MLQFLSKTKISSNASGQASCPQQKFSILVLTKMINKHIKKGLQKWNNYFFPRVLLFAALKSFRQLHFLHQSSTESTQKASEIVRWTQSFVLLPGNGSGIKDGIKDIITASLNIFAGRPCWTGVWRTSMFHFYGLSSLDYIRIFWENDTCK